MIIQEDYNKLLNTKDLTTDEKLSVVHFYIKNYPGMVVKQINNQIIFFQELIPQVSNEKDKIALNKALELIRQQLNITI